MWMGMITSAQRFGMAAFVPALTWAVISAAIVTAQTTRYTDNPYVIAPIAIFSRRGGCSIQPWDCRVSDASDELCPIVSPQYRQSVAVEVTVAPHMGHRLSMPLIVVGAARERRGVNQLKSTLRPLREPPSAAPQRSAPPPLAA